MRAIVIVLALGFIPALVVAWVFELTPEGLRRDEDVPPEESIAPKTAQRMNRMIVALLALAVLYFGFDKFVLAPRRDAALVAAVEQRATPPASSTSIANDNDDSIAVLPFVNMSSDKEQDYFSDGLSEELLNQLAQIPQLRVIARTSSFSFKGKEVDIAPIDVALLRAEVSRLSGDVAAARTFYTQALALAKAQQSASGGQQGEESDLLQMAEAEAGLGQRAAALQAIQSQLAAGRREHSTLSVVGAQLALARTYILLGDGDQAIAALDDDAPGTEFGGMVVVQLKLDPFWDPLRNDQRFQALLKKYSMDRPVSVPEGSAS